MKEIPKSLLEDNDGRGHQRAVPPERDQRMLVVLARPSATESSIAKSKRKRNMETAAKYSQAILSYRERRSESRVSFQTQTRVALIYDNLVHGKSVLELIQEYGINYSTIKHVLTQYYKHGKTDIRKYRPINYVPERLPKPQS